MKIVVPVKNQLELFKSWLKFLNPILNLREETEIPVLASFVLLAYNHRDYDSVVLNSLLFSEDTKLSIRRKLGFSERSFLKSFKNLSDKGLIVSDGDSFSLNPKVIPKEFTINIDFKVG